MKIKIDENLPRELSEVLAAHGHEVDTVHDEGLRGHPDVDVWQAAQAEQRFLITQDLDFSDARSFQPGKHCGVLLVRLRNPTRRQLLERIARAMQRSDLHHWNGCLVVLSESRIRIRNPPRE